MNSLDERAPSVLLLKMIQRHIYDPVKYLWWDFFAKLNSKYVSGTEQGLFGLYIYDGVLLRK